jgi:hypothetical protein
MKQMEANLRRELGMSADDITRMTSHNPRRALGAAE